jgi:hypothetical protein
MPEKKASPLSSYDARTFNLVANVPAALPPAREYVILQASVNPAAVGLSVGDGNGDSGLWPMGVQVITEGKLPARLSSTVTQTVTVLMVDGDVSVRDNRALMPVIGGQYNFSQAAGGPAIGLSNVVAAAVNVNGIELLSAVLAMRVDATADFQILVGGTIILRAFNSQIISLAGLPLVIPAGAALQIDGIGGGAIALSYRVR